MASLDSRKVPIILGTIFLDAILVSSLFLRYFSWQQIEKILSLSPLDCPLKRFTGLQCAFCGMTHSWIALLRGEWRTAFHYNWLGLPALLLAIVGAGMLIVPPAPKNFERFAKPLSVLGVLVLFSYTVFRNLKF